MLGRIFLQQLTYQQVKGGLDWSRFSFSILAGGPLMVLCYVTKRTIGLTQRELKLSGAFPCFHKYWGGKKDSRSVERRRRQRFFSIKQKEPHSGGHTRQKLAAADSQKKRIFVREKNPEYDSLTKIEGTGGGVVFCEWLNSGICRDKKGKIFRGIVRSISATEKDKKCWSVFYCYFFTISPLPPAKITSD